jgi:hypothetical protein
MPTGRRVRAIGAVSLALVLSIAIRGQAEAEVLLLDSPIDAQPITCADRDIVVSADGQRYSLVGKCRSLIVEGDRNMVSIALVPGSTLTVSGSGNQVYWTGKAPAPTILDAGSGNRITALGKAAR